MENNNESGILKFLYNTVPGRVVLKILTSPIISKIGGAYMDSPISKIHIKNFIKNNGINMADYEKAKYHSFNECFTRKILPEKQTGWNTVAMLYFRLATADCQFIGLMKSQLLILREVITKWQI